MSHYTKYIKATPDWSFAGIYADEGISATSTKKRDGFNSMIKDALDGKIDLIITKSVSRFARNTVDTIATVRKLKEKGIEVFFEKENISSLDGKGELLLTIMSSLAQEESRSISENVTWGQRKRFSDGKVSMPYKRFLGYEKGEDGAPKIVEDEAVTVRLIYRMFLKGKTPRAIALHLTENSIPTPSGKDQWAVSTIQSILQNEKYRGDALLQKKFTVDFLTKKQKVNEGEVPQYYVSNSHPAIIDPEVFDLVQEEIQKRKANGKRQSGVSCFSSKIICGECGSFYGPKIWHSTSRYRRTIWQCNNKYASNAACSTPHMCEDDIRAAFVLAFNQILTNKDKIIEAYPPIIAALLDTTEQDKKRTALLDECEVVEELIRKCVNEHSHEAQSRDEFQSRYDSLAARYTSATEQLGKLEAEINDKRLRHDKIKSFLNDILENGKPITEFSESLWVNTAESLTVMPDGALVFLFKDGSKVQVKAH